MISPDYGATSDPSEIYRQLMLAIADAKARRATMTAAFTGSSGGIIASLPIALYLGAAEWERLKKFCAEWDVEWSGATTDYDPVQIEESRAEFSAVKIYRVDAATFLSAT